MQKLGLLGFICLVLFAFSSYKSDPLPFLCKVADCRENKYVKMRIPNEIFEKTIELYWPIAYKKTEFECKGVPSELIIDNGKSYQAKDVFRGDSKNLVERNFQKTKKIIDDGYQGDKPEENKR